MRRLATTTVAAYILCRYRPSYFSRKMGGLRECDGFTRASVAMRAVATVAVAACMEGETFVSEEEDGRLGRGVAVDDADLDVMVDADVDGLLTTSAAAGAATAAATHRGTGPYAAASPGPSPGLDRSDVTRDQNFEMNTKAETGTECVRPRLRPKANP